MFEIALLSGGGTNFKRYLLCGAFAIVFISWKEKRDPKINTPHLLNIINIIAAH
tara:strand:- start:285 stop:446 length:162 start_codon:yes stop_codon:yes gene_type:complete